MADLNYRGEHLSFTRGLTDWRAIWAGMFTFAAVWSVFGLLGMAIFESAANATTNSTLTGISVGAGIWAFVLSIIAMYVAGRQTGRLAGVTNRHDGLIHGMIMFGLSMVAIVVIAALGGYTTGVSATTAHTYLYHMSPSVAWTGFFSLLFGWLAAMAGAATGTASKERLQTAQSVHELHPAA